ncbi:hypothetical protein PHLGIDRAFT_311728 [Phlebiopsis gigantea 11061_1 CR5-6]|uniref:Uncharacterized protein n=1 Tax=Phlebiopsis gigantea (strain 11061_1 CR5-6) TaxID=745531 RepID=A0A0C3NW06_PHLG1|nr:hypothetical protein PHLGIDRAFT_311728 [Phlebiopsis gigantea 11061_1 CR5-6]
MSCVSRSVRLPLGRQPCTCIQAIRRSADCDKYGWTHSGWLARQRMIECHGARSESSHVDHRSTAYGSGLSIRDRVGQNDAGLPRQALLLVSVWLFVSSVF